MYYNTLTLQNLPQHLSQQELRNPYIVIQSFLSGYDLPHTVRLLDKWITSALADKSHLSKNDCLAILDLHDHLIRLLEAAQLLNDETNYEEKAIDVSNADDATLLNTALYYTPHKAARAWECFPRHLCISEYGNPYLVFEKCLNQLNLSGWRRFLKALYHVATYDMPIHETLHDDNLRKTYKCLFKLVEACHLIYVREIDPSVQQEPITSKPEGPLSPASVLHAAND